MSFFLIAACGKVSELNPAVDLDDKALKTAEKLYCAEGQHLVEDRTALNVTFDKLRAKSEIFAFSNGNGPCALESDIDTTWPSEKDPLFFQVHINGTCLPNKSIWTSTAETLKTEQKYVFRRVGNPAWPELEMSGSHHLAGNYVAGITGLRVLVCQ